MTLISELDLPDLPIEGPEFSADPMRFLTPAQQKHPWLARFRAGYVVHGLQAGRDLLAMDNRMGPHFHGVVEHFGAEGTEWARFMSEQIATTSGAKHDRMRASLASAFTPRRANLLRPLMRDVISRLLDEWAARDSFDFVDFASHFPIAVMCGVMGISSDHVRETHDAIEAQILCLRMDRNLLPDIMAGYEVLRSFTADVIREREKSGERNSELLLDALIETKTAGGLDENELRDLVITLLLGGYDTSKNELALIMNSLIEHPDMYQRCAVDKAFCGKVVQETLRLTSVATPSRTVFEEFDYQGITFPRGTHICFAVALSGRDPAAYDEPMAFRPERKANTRHLAFGRGTHICLGQFLALAILEEGLHLIAQRMKNPRLAGEVTWRPFRAGIWGIRTLPVAIDPEQGSQRGG